MRLNTNRVMESETIEKNGTRLKDQKRKVNFHNTYLVIENEDLIIARWKDFFKKKQ